VCVQKYQKASPFARAAVLKNCINNKSVLSKIKTLWEKLGKGEPKTHAI
jgi:hypothetical protein